MQRPPWFYVGATISIWLTASTAAAQQDSSSASTDGDRSAKAQAQTTITVVAPTPGYRSTIDRKSYSISNDLQKTTGSLGDVLRNIPSVQVGSDGDVSVRGDPSVTILVDGKPSALFSGPGRAQAIQSMSADQFERVEVMTNPPAGVTAEGTGGVINLISRAAPKGRAAKPSLSGSLKASFGTGDRVDLGGSGAYSVQGLSLTGGLNFRRTGFFRRIDTEFGLPDPPVTGLTPATAAVAQSNRQDVLTLFGSLGYDVDPHDHVEVGINAFLGRLHQGERQDFQSSATSGPLALAYTADGFRLGHFTSVSESLGLTHTLPGDGQSLSVKLTVSQSRLTLENGAPYAYTSPTQGNVFQSQSHDGSFPEIDLAVDYKTVLPNKAKLALGYEATFDWQDQNDQGVEGASATSAAMDPALLEHYAFEQQTHALYATYEQAFGKLTVQPGLRLEVTTLQTDLVSAAERGGQNYVEVDPSLHLAYALDDASALKASYGRRVQRPQAMQLDPFADEQIATLFFAGNPNLKPAITQSYELGYEFRKKSTDVQATLFYRDKSDLLSEVVQDLGSDVLLSRWENIGHGRDVGLEFAATRDLTRTLSVSASTDVMNSEVDASNLGFAGTRAAVVASGQASFNWKVTQQDFVQLGGRASGKQLTAQGYMGSILSSSFGWRHVFDPRLALVVTAQDPFGVSRRTVAIDTPTLVRFEKRALNDSALFIGMTYALGGGGKRSTNNFDFGGQHSEAP